MPCTGRILLTGITGSVGSWIARKTLLAGNKILAVVRADTDDAAISRTQTALNIVGVGDLIGGVEVVRGDICLEGLGLGPGISRAADISLIIHCAAVLGFGEDLAELSGQVNVEGTAHVLKLAERLRVPVCHLSTAYVAGKRKGSVYESEIDVGQEFHNAYELSKCQGELLVNEWSRDTGLDAFIFRPGIVVGDTESGRIVNFDGLYNLMRFFDSIGSVIGSGEFRVIANPNATKNFIPVDYLADALWHVLEKGTPGTYHVTHPSPIKLSHLRQILADLFEIPGARLVHHRDFDKTEPTRLERIYQETASYYQPYLMGEPVFDRTNTDRALRGANLKVAEIDADSFSRLLSYARSVKWGKKHSKITTAAESSSYVVDRYFDHFLAEKMHKQLLPDLRSLSATCSIKVEDIPGRSWALRIEQGRLENISNNGADCQCAFLVDCDTFSRIVSGELTPQKAFFKRKIDIQGDMETGLKLATVLAAFFQKWPYRPGAEHGR
ncbi:MAG: SDR family oxidoreductase [Planctomycetes bacterium]|nr:SDR family oxidoreductase [Planctomycetota bacterium]